MARMAKELHRQKSKSCELLLSVWVLKAGTWPYSNFPHYYGLLIFTGEANMLQTAMQGFSIARTDCKASTIGWGAYMSYLAIYCLLYNGVVKSAPIDLMDSFIWVLREWGVWLVLTPLVFAALRALHAKVSTRDWWRYGPLYTWLGVAVLTTALVYRVGIDVYGGADLAASAVYFFPKHVTALVLVVLAWHLVRATERMDSGKAIAPVQAPLQSQAQTQTQEPLPETLLVSKGQHERLIRVEQIDVISAAGNYVDIRCNDDVYLLRSSLKQLEDILPAHQFIRVHRSHLVNVNSLMHMTKTAAGNGSVVMHDGHVVPMSKKYRTALKKISCAGHTAN